MKICFFDSIKFLIGNAVEYRRVFYASVFFLLTLFLSFIQSAILMSALDISQNQNKSASNIKTFEKILIGSNSADATVYKEIYACSMQKDAQSNEIIVVDFENKNEKEQSNFQQSTDNSIKKNSSDINNLDVINFNQNNSVINQVQPIQTDIKEAIPLNLKTLKDFIKKNDNTIFEKYDIFSLFDLISKITDRELVFYWKGRLHKKLVNYDLLKKIANEKISLHVKRSLKKDLKYITAVYDHHMYFRKAYNKLPIENSSSDPAVYEFCKKEVELRPESVFSTEKTAFQENMIFVKKFNGIFDLFWKKFFLVLKEDKRIAPLDDDSMLKFYNINTKMSIPYDSFDYMKLNFGNIKTRMGVEVNVGNRDNLDINIILFSMTSHTNARVNHFNPIFFNYSFLTKLDRFIDTCKDLKLSNLYDTVDGKLRYSDAGKKLINNVSMFVRKSFSQLFEFYVDNSTIQFDFGSCGFLGEPENNNARISEDVNKINNKKDAFLILKKQQKPGRDELNIFVHDWTTCKWPTFLYRCNDCINGVNVHAGLYPDKSNLDLI
ncbi:hypothetical protein EDEG_03938 [Edhazardia aedis USNM 41457]|uniref:Uncharacterized protein n=1 Tax=Edhazardia aedis (strain USNM 41457) TaxID=1003232 RepID=J9DFU6_EDHAE|nr:hypothetical protein EDEG_03938 [Edhazardia aedis USNM 41457]|eukprot:EJW01475.1 hypothetical protein EDEG_03938 [Edhazardia aedis USNM 41457]